MTWLPARHRAREVARRRVAKDLVDPPRIVGDHRHAGRLDLEGGDRDH
jgi:hypothetical protein